MGPLSRAGVVFVLILAGCSATPAAVSPTPFATEPVETEPLDTEPIDTEAPTDTLEPTPVADHSADGGLPLSDGNGWPMTVSATLSGTFYDSDGSYSGSGAARWCGNALGNISLNLRAFNFEFPLDTATGNIRDVTFSADDLVPGATTGIFHIDVGVHTAAGGDPASTVINAGETGTAVSGTGTAQLTVDGSTRTLQVDATSDDGEHIKLKGSCSPS
jgi:hypothetical protein